MANAKTVHILDPDITRRGAVARQIFGFGMHAEIYEGLSELSSSPPSSGVLLAFDDREGPDISDIIGTIGQNGSFVPVAMYSGHPDPERIVDAMLSGALDYLSLPVEPAALRRSLDRLDHSNRALAARKRKEAGARNMVDALSGREREVLRALVSGAPNKEIAKVMGISPRTVEIHRANVMRKLAASTTADAVRIGLFAGLDS